MPEFHVAIAGATGLVGSTMLQVLEDRAFPVARLQLYASGRGERRALHFNGRELPVQPLAEADFQEVHFAFFATASAISRRFVPKAVAAGAWAIDNSSAFRQQADVPIIVPEVNADLLHPETRLIANPNCSTAQLVVVLAPLHRAFGLRRVVVSTYQSVSGSGLQGLSQLEAECRGQVAGDPIYPRPIFDNCLPHIGDFDAEGSCEEERKIVFELRKILALPELAIAATTVRVPVRHCHSESVLVEFKQPVDVHAARQQLASAANVILMDDPGRGVYPVAREVAARDEVCVGRIRAVPGWPNALLLWVVADNLRKGAATNAVQIAECIIEKGWTQAPT